MNNRQSNLHIAICLFGLNRSLSITQKSIRDCVIEPYSKIGKVHLFGAFLKPNNPISNPRSNEINLNTENTEHHFDFEDLKLINQEAFDDKFQPQNLVTQAPDCYSDGYKSAINICRALYSVQEVFDCAQRKRKHDIYVFARPDLFYIDVFRAEEHARILQSDERSILTPIWQQWGGLNDRLAVMTHDVAQIFSKRFIHIEEFIHKSKEPLHPESMLLWFAIKHRFNYSQTLTERGIRVRANGVFNTENFSQTGISDDLVKKYLSLQNGVHNA